MIKAADTLTAAEFDALFDAFARTVVRLEALPSYAVGGAEQARIDAYQRGLPRPERSVRTDPWLARIAVSTVSAGKRWSRIRVVDDPLTRYQRYQMESYREAQACGDQISVVRRSEVGEVGEDVWLFDAGSTQAHAVWMRYRDDGSVASRDLVTDPQVLAGVASEIGRIAEAAVPLNEFLAVAG